MINFNIPEGVVVAAYRFVATDEIAGNNRVGIVHCEIAAYGQNGCGEGRTGYGQELHIHGQRCVAGKIYAALFVPDDKTAGIAAVGAVGQYAGVYGIDVLDRAEVEMPGAAVVHRMPLEPLGFVPTNDFEIGDDNRMVVFPNFLGVGYVVAVAVR